MLVLLRPLKVIYKRLGGFLDIVVYALLTQLKEAFFRLTGLRFANHLQRGL